MELKEGMYVRTDEGIAKVINKRKNPYGEETIFMIDKPFIYHFADFLKTSEDMIDVNFEEDTSQIKGASHNIVDLIEEGDYVNGECVYSVARDIEKHFVCVETGIFLNNEIKSIVTKEQFELMQYKI